MRSTMARSKLDSFNWRNSVLSSKIICGMVVLLIQLWWLQLLLILISNSRYNFLAEQCLVPQDHLWYGIWPSQKFLMDHQQILSNFCYEVVHSFILLPVSRCNVLLYGAMLVECQKMSNLAMNMCDAVEVPGNCERLVCVVPKNFTLGGYGGQRWQRRYRANLFTFSVPWLLSLIFWH